MYIYIYTYTYICTHPRQGLEPGAISFNAAVGACGGQWEQAGNSITLL